MGVSSPVSFRSTLLKLSLKIFQDGGASRPGFDSWCSPNSLRLNRLHLECGSLTELIEPSSLSPAELVLQKEHYLM